MHRHTSQFDPCVDRKVDLTLETTVQAWREACDLLPWRELRRAYNEYFGIHPTDTEWQVVLEPSHKRSLREVCEFVAARAVRLRVRPAGLLGVRCAAAGIFLATREFLQSAGEDVREIAPSTPLSEYTRRHAMRLLQQSVLWAPGALPPVRIVHRMYERATLGLLIGYGCAFAGLAAWALTGSLLTLLFAFVPMVLAHAAVSFAAKSLPDSVDFGDLKTFCDWSVAISRGST